MFEECRISELYEKYQKKGGGASTIISKASSQAYVPDYDRKVFAWLGLHWYHWLIMFAAIIIIISGPSMVMAWLKLRKRNLSPVLNANGWALNARVLVNVRFGATLTSIAKYPIVKTKDPFTMKAPWWKRMLRWLVVIIVVAVAVYFILPKDMRPFQSCCQKTAVEIVEKTAE